MERKFNIGDVVYCTRFGFGEVKAFSGITDSVIVEFDRPAAVPLHNCGGKTKDGHGFYFGADGDYCGHKIIKTTRDSGLIKLIDKFYEDGSFKNLPRLARKAISTLRSDIFGIKSVCLLDEKYHVYACEYGIPYQLFEYVAPVESVTKDTVKQDKYEVGDRVRILPLSDFKKVRGINISGKMDKWAGQEMTILSVDNADRFGYQMKEDQGDFPGAHIGVGWSWSNDMIEGKITIKKEEKVMKQEMYKIGDKVRIIPLDELKKNTHINEDGGMDKWAGTVMTIVAIEPEGNLTYKMEEDKAEWYGGWHWYPEMIEGKVSSSFAAVAPAIPLEGTIVKQETYEVGDKIKIVPLEQLVKCYDCPNDMHQYADRVFTVTHGGSSCHVKEAGWSWHNDMILGKVVTEKAKVETPRFKVGDKVWSEYFGEMVITEIRSFGEYPIVAKVKRDSSHDGLFTFKLNGVYFQREDDAHNIVPFNERKSKIRKYTEEEIREARDIICSILTDEYSADNGNATMRAEYRGKTTTVTGYTSNKFTSVCSETDEYNRDIGLMVCLCKAAHRSLPKWIKE